MLHFALGSGLQHFLLFQIGMSKPTHPPTPKSPQLSMKDTKKDFSLTEAFCVNFGFLVNNMLQ